MSHTISNVHTILKITTFPFSQVWKQIWWYRWFVKAFTVYQKQSQGPNQSCWSHMYTPELHPVLLILLVNRVPCLWRSYEVSLLREAPHSYLLPFSSRCLAGSSLFISLLKPYPWAPPWFFPIPSDYSNLIIALRSLFNLQDNNSILWSSNKIYF